MTKTKERLARKPRWRTRDIHSLYTPDYTPDGYQWCTRRSTQVLLYLVPSKYLFLPSSQAHSSEITFDMSWKTVHCIAHVLKRVYNFVGIATRVTPTRIERSHFHISNNAPHLRPPSPRQIFRNLCFSFLLGITAVPREIRDLKIRRRRRQRKRHKSSWFN